MLFPHKRKGLSLASDEKSEASFYTYFLASFTEKGK